MTQRNRAYLKQEFQDGERPSGVDFADLVDSFLNLEEDTAALDGDGTLILTGGLGLGDSARDEAGFLRFSGGRVQFHDGSEWRDLGSGGGAFEQVGGSSAVAYQGGNVGIGGGFGEVQPPSHLLEVRGTTRLGDLVCGSGPSADDAFLHNANLGDPNTQYALRQRSNGEVFLNAPAARRIRIGQANSNTPALGVTTNGNVVLGSANNIPAISAHRLQVNGSAGKTEGGDMWNTPSDARVKEDVRDLEAGLEQLLQVRPVRFRYNGKGGTRAGSEGIGIIGQEIEQVFPEMVQRVPSETGDGAEPEELLVYNGSGLTYVLVNAVKELAARVGRLEAELAARREESAQ